MDVIFDIKADPNWADSTNAEIIDGFPKYFETNPVIGSAEWWQSAEVDVLRGRITQVGEVFEENELFDVVTIQPLDDDFNGDDSHGISQPELQYIREDFWEHDAVAVDKLVEISSVTICPSGELDNDAIYVEVGVRVW